MIILRLFRLGPHLSDMLACSPHISGASCSLYCTIMPSNSKHLWIMPFLKALSKICALMYDMALKSHSWRYRNFCALNLLIACHLWQIMCLALYYMYATACSTGFRENFSFMAHERTTHISQRGKQPRALCSSVVPETTIRQGNSKSLLVTTHSLSETVGLNENALNRFSWHLSVVWPCWRKFVTDGALWGFRSPSLSQWKIIFFWCIWILIWKSQLSLWHHVCLDDHCAPRHELNLWIISQFQLIGFLYRSCYDHDVCS